jgi:hypothetical protein
MAKKTVSERIIEYVRKRADRLNSTLYYVVEFVVQNGRVGGVRFKEYERLEKDDEDDEGKVLKVRHGM